MAYDELVAALELFGLRDHATLGEIRRRHRQLVKEHHPDHNPDSDDTTIRKINRAYEILRTYCSNYRYTFSLEEYLQQNPEERMRHQFYDDPVWGGKKS